MTHAYAHSYMHDYIFADETIFIYNVFQEGMIRTCMCFRINKRRPRLNRGQRLVLVTDSLPRTNIPLQYRGLQLATLSAHADRILALSKQRRESANLYFALNSS